MATSTQQTVFPSSEKWNSIHALVYASLYQNTGKSYHPNDPLHDLLNQLIYAHLTKQGLFHAAHVLAHESNLISEGKLNAPLIEKQCASKIGMSMPGNKSVLARLVAKGIISGSVQINDNPVKRESENDEIIILDDETESNPTNAMFHSENDFDQVNIGNEEEKEPVLESQESVSDSSLKEFENEQIVSTHELIRSDKTDKSIDALQDMECNDEAVDEPRSELSESIVSLPTESIEELDESIAEVMETEAHPPLEKEIHPWRSDSVPSLLLKESTSLENEEMPEYEDDFEDSSSGF